MSDDEFCNTDSLSYWLIQAAKAHRARAQATLAEAGLYPGQEMILMSLWNQNGQTLTALSEDLCVQPATITKMVNRLEKSGLLERQPDPTDGRAKRIYLTPGGQALREETLAAWHQLEANTTQNLTPHEQATLQTLLKKVARGLLATNTS